MVRFIWKGDRVVDCGGLENRCAATYHGFESHPFRHMNFKKFFLIFVFLFYNSICVIYNGVNYTFLFLWSIIMIKKALSFFVACPFGIGLVHGAQQQTFEQRFQERFLPAQVEWCSDINNGPIEGESFATTFHRMTGNELTVEYLKEH